MKIFINCLILKALVIIGFLVSSDIIAQEPEWNFELELTKQSYILHEPIWLDVTLTNKTSDTLRTNGLVEPNHLGFIIDLRNNQGEIVDYTGGHSDYGFIRGRLLIESGERDFGSFNLLSSFGLEPWRFPYIPKGNYTVQAQFNGAISNELTFSIVEPFGEEIEVLKLIDKANEIWNQDNTVPSADIFRRVVDEHPNSVLAERCYYFSLIYTHRADRLAGNYDSRTTKRALLTKYPNSGNSKSWFSAITREFTDEQKLDLLNELVENNPNTRFSKFAPQIKKRILNKKEEE